MSQQKNIRHMAYATADIATPSWLVLPVPHNRVDRSKNPASLRLDGFGKLLDSRTFALNEKPRKGWRRLPGGTTPGGLVILPPEVDMRDVNATGSGFSPPGVSKSESYFGVAAGAAFFAGIPYPNTGGIRLGYSWKADSSGVLVYGRHNTAGTRRDAVRFTDTERIGLRANTNFWGDLYHAITANRAWKFPDCSGDVLVDCTSTGGVVQKGTAAFVATVGSIAVTFPSAFTSAPVVTTSLERSGAPVQSVQIEAVTATGFTARRTSASGTATLHWIAMGA